MKNSLTTSLPINFSYKGKTHFIDANTLLLTQTHFLTILNEINTSLNSSVIFNLKIEAVKPGSFELNQLLTVAAASEIFSAPNVEYIDNILSLFSNIISLKSFLKDSKAEHVEVNNENPQTINVHLHGDNITIQEGAFKIYQTNNSVNNAIGKMGEALINDNDVTGLELKNLKNKNTILEIQKCDFKDLTLKNDYLDTDTKEEIKDDAILTITKPDLNPKKKSKWNFIYNARRISNISINDDDFLRKVSDGVYKFGNGDALRVKLKIVYKLDKNYNVFLESKFEIMNVIEPIFIKQQEKLRF